MTSAMQGPIRPTIYRFKLGNFEITNILDSFVVRENMAGSFHAGGPAEEAHELARANRIDPNKYEHPFVQTLVNTGKELILFDTGNGTLARDIEAVLGDAIHAQSMAMQGGVMSMQRLDGVDLPAKGELKFAPGGYHVMLFGVNPQVKPGSRIGLTVRFAKGPPLTLGAKVVGAGEDAPY